jgi:hypothetical protein
MDNVSKSKLEEILKKEQAALTEGDKQFLRARESYLTADQKEAYAEVFDAPAAQTEDAKPKKKDK